LAPFTWAAEPEPEEYREDEFAPWVHDLRRAEIVAFGSLPFSMFLVTLGYDSVRYAVHFEEPEARRYAPWPFRSANPAPYTTEETIGMVVGVIACSVAVSVADFLIGRILERRAQAR
jgi:hypothetical protein